MTGAAEEGVLETTELSTEECLELLERNRFGRLAAVLGEGAPLIRPVNYAFDASARSIAIRAAAGSMLLALLDSPRAAFEIDAVDRVARTAWSVVAVGPCEEVSLAASIDRLERLGLRSWAAGEEASWIAIRVSSLSGLRFRLSARHAAALSRAPSV
jgi:nitroimidazol reductase NimA-like FMN-containing flavoprotein (pyridoxamine 5'-phosphate oxidase superfamily)